MGPSLIVIFLMGECIAFYVVKFIIKQNRRKKCTAVTQGKFSYGDYVYLGYKGTPRCIPVYEYTVENILYIAKFEMRGSWENSYAREVEVHYDPNKPEMCYIDNFSGINLSKTVLDESITGE